MSCSMQYIHWTILFMSQTVHYLHYSRHGECTTFTIHVIKSALPSLNYSSHEKCPTFNELFMSQSVQERHWTIHVTVSAGETLNHSCHSECRRDTEPFMSRRMPYLQVFLEFVPGCTATHIRWVQRDDVLPFSVLDQVGHGPCDHSVGRNGAEKGGVPVTAGRKRCIHFLLNVDNIKMSVHSVLFLSLIHISEPTRRS